MSWGTTHRRVPLGLSIILVILATLLLLQSTGSRARPLIIVIIPLPTLAQKRDEGIADRVLAAGHLGSADHDVSFTNCSRIRSGKVECDRDEGRGEVG